MEDNRLREQVRYGRIGQGFKMGKNYLKKLKEDKHKKKPGEKKRKKRKKNHEN